eukprot:4529623-Pleurochrysis_carterae.AAC.1
MGGGRARKGKRERVCATSLPQSVNTESTKANPQHGVDKSPSTRLLGPWERCRIDRRVRRSNGRVNASSGKARDACVHQACRTQMCARGGERPNCRRRSFAKRTRWPKEEAAAPSGKSLGSPVPSSSWSTRNRATAGDAPRQPTRDAGETTSRAPTPRRSAPPEKRSKHEPKERARTRSATAGHDSKHRSGSLAPERPDCPQALGRRIGGGHAH